ncbi:MAG: ABC-F family ATP-binding cassette domain-containing protein [Clostridia bacterium]|nr:ABC-F family ATP-binding cassette domain-containing protein [Clostridia bacterium]
MIILNCNNISLSFGTNKILDNISFSIQDSEKVGLVGVNGAGKSTLFKILSGILQPDSGEVFIAKGLKIGYLEQNTGLDSSRSLWDELLEVFLPLIEMEKRLKLLEEKISKEKNEESLASLMKEYASLTEVFANSGGYLYNSKMKGTLRGLGFSDETFHAPVNILSGGQKTRLALAKLLLEEPDILFLDEPTNHLDIAATEWLESFLKSYPKSVLLISHDRYFLDIVTNKTIEIENCECSVYNGNYTYYIDQKAKNREVQQKHYELQQKEIARMEAFIEQQRRWNREKNIIAAESRQKAIDRMEKIDRPKKLPDQIRIKFSSSITSGNDVLFVENLTKEYPGKSLFRNINFNMKKAERVFLLGPNGCGKSTMMKIIAGNLEATSGCVEFGHNVKLGYYDQEHQSLDDNNTVLEEVWDDNDKLTHTEIRNALASFLFRGDDVFKPVSVLSGGEKGRVSLVKLMLSGSNLLLLDEPTNHLDIHSREVLEESLKNYDGSLLVVSHDRYFINKLSSRILEINADQLLDFSGNYSDFIEYKNKLTKNNIASESEVRISASKLERMAAKEEQTRQRRLERQINETETEINQIETRLGEIDSEMLSEETASDHMKLAQLHEEQCLLQSKLEELYERWEVLSSEKQSMEK